MPTDPETGRTTAQRAGIALLVFLVGLPVIGIPLWRETQFPCLPTDHVCDGPPMLGLIALLATPFVSALVAAIVFAVLARYDRRKNR
jgi:hypothetical protein